MKVELINATQYANIYGVYTNAGKVAGTIEVVLAGRNVGTYVYSWSRDYTRREIRKAYNEWRRSR